MKRAAFAALPALLMLTPAHAETSPEDLVNALNAVFGKHAGLRAAHANGLCVSGSFAPSAEAAQLSKAPHFAGSGPFKVVGRFSMGGGNPAAPNTQKDNARGLALHIDIGKGNTTDMVLITAPVFVAKNPDDFLALLQTVATKDPEKIGSYFKAHPESARQGAWLKERPVPASYASATYFGVHAFTLTNAAGDKRVIKWELTPTAGDVGLSDDEVKGKAPDFYTAELKERFAKGPATFKLMAVIGESGDPTDDPTALWPTDKRKKTEMGTLTLTAFEDRAACDAGMFDPTLLVDGIAGPVDDKIFPMRSSAYAVSLSRRAN